MGKKNRVAARLRKQAEDVLKSAPSDGRVVSSEIRHLVHELQIYQVELEMQSDELERITRELQQSCDHYRDLYDFAPVAYLTLGEDGQIKQANLTCATWLGTAPQQLVTERLSNFVVPDDQDKLYLYLKSLLAQRKPDATDIRLVHTNGTPFYVRLDGILKADAEGQLCIRLVLTDVYEQKKAEAAVQVYQTELEQRVEDGTANLRQANSDFQEQRLQTETLIEIVSGLNTSLDLEEVLDRILTNLRRIVPHDTASVLLVEDDQLIVVRSAGNGKQHLEDAIKSQQIYLKDVPHLSSTLSASPRQVVGSISGGRYWLKSPVSHQVRSYICTPILKDGDVLGILTVESFTPDSFSEHQARLVQAVAHHAALAIWNVYACMNQQEAAVSRERERIAMELHDAVSQSLWSATMIAESLPDLWQKNPVQALEKSRILNEITRGTLAEMRALMLEIRPDEIETTSLVQSVGWLVKAVQSHLDIPLEYTSEGEEHLPPEVRRSMYRMTQEALNNSVRHAHPTHIRVSLSCLPNEVLLTVRDNGVGFMMDALPIPGHYGIVNMQKRAKAVGASLSIISQPDQGTTVELRYPV